MKHHRQRSANTGKRPMEKEKTRKQEEGGPDEESCRCKEVSKKTPTEMLKLMINDLAFWKKAKGHK